jgi:HEAT repeat protein
MADGFDNWSARGRAPGAPDERPPQERLVAQLTDDTATSRERADAALGLVDASAEAETDLSSETITALSERVRDDPADDVRQFAVEALGNAGVGTEAIRDALDDANEWVRAEAVVACSRAVGVEAAETLREALDDDGGHVRRNALVALGKFDAVDAETLLDRLKHDPNSGVREYAAAFLAETPGDTYETVTVLAAVLARDPDAFVRAKAAKSLGELGTDRAIQALESHGVEDSSDDVKRSAKRALAVARGRDPETVSVEEARPPGGGPASPEETPTPGGESPAMGHDPNDRGLTGQSGGPTPRAVSPSEGAPDREIDPSVSVSESAPETESDDKPDGGSDR